MSESLLAELAAVLARPKLRSRVAGADAAELQRQLSERAVLASDPASAPPVHSRDRDDDYLFALAHIERAALVSGDRDLLELAGSAPVFSPAEFLSLLDERTGA